MTPADEATLEFSTSLVDNDGRRTYEVENPVENTEHTIVLVDESNVSVDADGIVTFTDANDDGEADGVEAPASARIELLNGSAADGSATQTAEPASDGTLTFTIDSNSSTEANVVPVVFFDEDEDGSLDVDADGAPTADEVFGIGGVTNYVPAEATATDGGAITVDSADLSADYFVANDGLTYYYDSNDIFRYDGGANVDMSTFEGMLTALDDITVTYDPDAADTSIFDVTDDDVASPTNLEVTVSDLDGDGDADDATITWDAVAQLDAVYNVYEDDGDNANTLEPAGTDTDDTLTEQTSATMVTINNVVDGAVYHVGAEGGTSGEVSLTDDSVTTNHPVDLSPEVLADGAVVDSDADGSNDATDGDVWTFYLSEGVTVGSGAAIQLTDASGPVIENGAGATFALNADGDILTVTLTADPSTTTAYPAPIHAIAGITDADEDGDDLGFGNDSSLENNGVEPLYAGTDGFTEGDGETEVSVTFNEALIEVSAENTANYTFVNDGGPTNSISSAVLGTDNRTVTFTFAEVLSDGDTLTAKNTLLDTDGDGATAVTLTVADAGVAPFITATSLTADSDTNDIWDADTDKLTISWSETVTHVSGNGELSDAEVEAVLGTAVEPAGTSTMTLAGDGTDEWTLTVGTATLTEGVAVGDITDGTANADVTDAGGNAQVVNPNADPTMTDGVS